MVTVLYGAILVAADGILSLMLDRDVIAEPDAGPLVGPVMAAVALIVVFFSLLGGLKPANKTRRLPVGRAATAALLCFVAAPAIGAIVYAFGQPQLGSAVGFFVLYLLSPFVVASAVFAFATVLLLPWIDTARSRAR